MASLETHEAVAVWQACSSHETLTVAVVGTTSLATSTLKTVVAGMTCSLVTSLVTTVLVAVALETSLENVVVVDSVT